MNFSSNIQLYTLLVISTVIFYCPVLSQHIFCDWYDVYDCWLWGRVRDGCYRFVFYWQDSAMEISCFLNVQLVMECIDSDWMCQEAQKILKDQCEGQCFMCMGEFDQEEYAPMMMCMNQHSCCAPCMQQLIKNNKNFNCPHCQQPLNRKTVAKNRLLITIYQLVEAFKKQIKQLQTEIQSLKKAPSCQTRASLTSKNPKLVKSFIFSQCGMPQRVLNQSIFDEAPTYRSLTWVGPEKRRENLKVYAQREKIEQLKRVVRNDVPFEQVMKLRSGYGSIKKIECMQYFTNLRELLLYNNHIKVIEGLNNNIKLNVLSLAYNRIEKVENIGHLKQLKRLSLECNKLKKSSAEYMSTYDWKTLQSLAISFHETNLQDNEECILMLFGGNSLVQWSNLKTLYIYNSKGMGEQLRAVIKEFASKRKIPVQVYWS